MFLILSFEVQKFFILMRFILSISYGSCFLYLKKSFISQVHEDILLFSSKSMIAFTMTFEFAYGVRYGQGLLFFFVAIQFTLHPVFIENTIFNLLNCSGGFVVNHWVM